jgi:ABC-2 type transport system permease protein
LFAAILIFGTFFGMDLSGINIGSAIVVMLLIILSFFAQALVLGALMVSFRDTYISQNTLFVLMNLICGVLFPIQYLPVWLQPLSYMMPMTFGLDAFRSGVIGGGDLTSSGGDLLALIGLTVLYLVLGAWWIKKVEQNIVEKLYD